MLTLRNLGKSFDNGSERLPLFHHLDLALAAGEITLLLGQSGCGKSTLLNLIAGLLPRMRGRSGWGRPALTTSRRTSGPACAAAISASSIRTSTCCRP